MLTSSSRRRARARYTHTHRDRYKYEKEHAPLRPLTLGGHLRAKTLGLRSAPTLALEPPTCTSRGPGHRSGRDSSFLHALHAAPRPCNEALHHTRNTQIQISDNPTDTQDTTTRMRFNLTQDHVSSSLARGGSHPLHGNLRNLGASKPQAQVSGLRGRVFGGLGAQRLEGSGFRR